MLEHLVELLTPEFDVVALAVDGAGALEAARRFAPDLAVLDIALPRMSGIAVAAQLQSAGFKGKVVFVTMYRDREFLQAALELGQVGYVAKDRLVMDLVPAIQAVEAGRSFVSPSFVP